MLPFSIHSRIRQALLSLAAVLAASRLHAGETPAVPAEQADFFEKKIRPVLAEQCLKCHSTAAEKIKGGLVMDTRAAILKGGDSGPAAVAGNVEKSLLIEAIHYTDEDLQMPPKHRLSPEQVADFEQWVKLGLPDPRENAAATAAANSPADGEKARQFWSFQPVKDAPPPAVKNPGWVRNPIDQFILAKLEEHGLQPNPDVDKRRLLRRATYDLLGLPPTPAEMDAFLADDSPEAFAHVVDRLLASPHYGEQWGRHWLDVARYADTSGCNSDFPIPAAYRYRNYVIDAFNHDKPFDQFIREQIAGDLLPAANDAESFEHTIATGYLAISRRFGSRASEFYLTIDDTIDALGKGVLGLSVGCARCHDHKFDPIPTKDYYALYGIFDSTTYAFPGTEIYRHTKDFIPLAPKAEADQFKKEATELAGLDDKIEKLKEEKKRLARDEEKLAALPASDPASPQFIDPPRSETPKRRTSADAKQELQAATERQHELEGRQERLVKAYGVSEGRAHNVQIHKKGDAGTLGDEAPRAFLTVLGGQSVPAEETGSGRKELAEWLTDPHNPLTPRVMANRIWQHHFGRGIVRTPNDFGIRGERPTHPELLDWLASRFVENGWSIKAMHRLILLSHAYQMSSDDTPASAAADANNDLFWRCNRQRLSAEEIRDSILFAAGGLDLTPGGPQPFPPEAEWHYTQHQPFVADYPTNKRAIYLLQQRIRKQPFLDIFDGADTNSTTGLRPLSTTPIQALFLMNNGLVHDQAAKFAERAMAAGPEAEEQIACAYQIALGRLPTPEESKEAEDYLEEIGQAFKETNLSPDQQPRAAFASFARVLMSSNEFLFIE